MRLQLKKFREAVHIVLDVVSATWRRFLRGPGGSVGIVRWVGAWVVHTLLALVSVTTALRERPHQLTLWWLLILAWFVSNVAAAAREQKRHDPRAWVGVMIVYLIGGMAVPFAWQGVGLTLLIAAAIHSWPVEVVVVLVRRAAGWATAALIWVGAWALLTNLGLAVLEPAPRAVNARGASVLSIALSAVSTVLSASSALLVLWIVVRGYRRLQQRREVTT